MRKIEKLFTGFKYPDVNDPVFAELKLEAGIELSVADTISKAKIIIGYAHTLFAHDGDNQPSSLDALTILKEAKRGESFRCVEYSILAAGLLWVYGIPARVAGLKTQDVETREFGAGHVVIEFWVPERQKWVMCDVQWGVMPKSNDLFLTAAEFGEAIRAEKFIEYETVEGSRFTSGKGAEYTNWIREYLYFYDTDIQVLHTGKYTIEDAKKELKLMLVPKGVKPPKMFQNAFKVNLICTDNLSDFYPKYKML